MKVDKEDELGFYRALESCLEEGWLKETYENGKQYYSLTPEGKAYVMKLVKTNPTAFDFLFSISVKNAKTSRDIVQFLLFTIYHIFYGMTEEDARKRSEKWFKR